MARIFQSIPAEQEMFSRLEASRNRRAIARAQATESVAQRADVLRDQYSWLSPDVTFALAAAGIGVDHPAMAEIAKAGAKRKAKSGFGWHTFGSPIRAVKEVAGDVLAPVARVVDSALGGVDETIISGAVKPAVRTAALVAQSAYEEAQGIVRNVAAVSPEAAGAGVGAALGSIVPGVGTAIGAGVGGVLGGALGHLARDDIQGEARWEPQSSGAVSLERLLNGERVDLGTGFLPNVNAGESEEAPDSTFTIGEAQRQRAGRVTVGGRSLTPGRLLAAGVVEPGSDAHNVLSGLVDASLALSRFDPASALGKSASTANKNRRLFVAGGVNGRRNTVLPEIVDEWFMSRQGRDVIDSIANEASIDAIWNATGKRIPIKTVRELADVSTPAEVENILRPLLGVGIREKFKYRTFKPLDNVRLAQKMPGHTVDLVDPDKAVETVDRWLRNANAPRKMVEEFVDRMARAGGTIGRMDVLEDVMDATRDVLVSYGVDPKRARRMTKMTDAIDDNRLYWINQIGENVAVPGVNIGGKKYVPPHPHIFAEYLHRALPLPDVREVRRAASEWAPLFDNDVIKATGAAADWLQDKWKRTSLLRGAYTVRVIGEEQVRMGAGGLDSMFNHPLSYIAWRTGQKGAGDIKGGTFAYKDADEFAEALDEFNQAMSRQWAGWVDQKKIPTGDWNKIHRDEPEFVDAWAGELLQLASDPVAREIARATSGLDPIKQAFWDGNLRGFREQMAEQIPDLRKRKTADRYIDSTLERIRTKTNGDSDLIDAIGSSHMAGSKIRKGIRPSREFRDELEVRVGAFGDDVVMKAPKVIAGTKYAGWWDQATTYAFSQLMGQRTNNLSRQPVFKQKYWQRSEELLPQMDAATQAKVLAEARAAGFKGDDIGRMEQRAALSTGVLNVDQADVAAKGYALDETKALLYDLSEKGQFFDAARLIFPFGEAWQEVLTRWTKLTTQEFGVPARRAQQVIQGARGAGFFHENAYGEEVFSYPGSAWISEKLFGIPVPLTGRVAGLSLMTEVAPGVGPVVQIPAGALLPTMPEFDFMREIIFPFGGVAVDERGLIESLAPAWLRRWQDAGIVPGRDERTWNNAVMDVARWIASTGKYDTSDPDQMAALLKEAQDKAAPFLAFRGASQFFAPTAPNPEWVVKDKNGDVQVAQVLLEEFHALEAKDYDSAVLEMLDRYGENIWLLLQGKSRSIGVDQPVTKEAAAWERSLPDVAERFPYVVGLFAPDGEDIDFAAMDRLRSQGRVEDLTPDEILRLAQDKIARAKYAAVKSQVGPSPSKPQSDWLAGVKAALQREYPGFEDRSGVPENVKLPKLIEQLERAVDDPALADHPLTGAVRNYFAARSKAQEAATSLGLRTFATAKKAEPIRAWLRQLAAAVVRETPEFAETWELVFSRELADEVTSEEAVAA